MQESDVVAILGQALVVTLKISAPILIISMVVGLVISIIQTTTSIQEQTLTFVPKLIAVFLSIAVFFAWILHTAMDFTRNMYNLIALY